MERNTSPANEHLRVSHTKLEYIAIGKAGVVYGIDNDRILKEYHDPDGKDVEYRAYQRLGPHPNIARYLGSTTEGSIILERGRALQTASTKADEDPVPLNRKIRWLQHAAEGLRYVHEKGIVHADVACCNMILTDGDFLKIIDFEGCSIDGEPAGSLYQWFSYRPSTPKTSKQTDIFAYGCVMYEILTGWPPYHELEQSEVEQLYKNNQFPDVTQLPLGSIIQRCWDSTFDCMSGVIQALEAASLPTTKPPRSRCRNIRGWRTIKNLLTCCYSS